MREFIQESFWIFMGLVVALFLASAFIASFAIVVRYAFWIIDLVFSF